MTELITGLLMYTTLSRNTRNLIAMQAVIIGIQLYLMQCACADDFSDGIELVCMDDSKSPRFAARNYGPDHDGNSETFKRKSYILGVAPTFVPVIGPMIGHMYIGRENGIRGIHYGLLSGSAGVLAVASALACGLGGQSDCPMAGVLGTYAMWGYVLGILDAGISVYNHNNHVQYKSYIISIGSSLVCPYLAHTHLKGEKSPIMTITTIGFFGGITSGCPEVIISSLLIGACNAAYLADSCNKRLHKQQSSNVTIIPDLESRMLKVAWTF